ncbi:hypothetical protein N8371_06355, partial [Vicingaceae bacterium]|nr:hypothetical protein [Vicingaceae bacterium]
MLFLVAIPQALLCFRTANVGSSFLNSAIKFTAAKNFDDVLTVSSREQYSEVLTLLEEKGGETNKADRKAMARKAFDISSHYDSKIFDYFNAEGETESLKLSERETAT